MSSLRLLAAVAVASGLCGCVVGPTYRAPSPPPGAVAAYGAADPALETSDEPVDSWWRLYDDPQLDGLIQTAIVANTDLRAAGANLEAARAIFDAARSERSPSTTFEAGGVYGRDATTDEILELGGARPATTWLFDDIFSASYELDLFGRIHRLVEASKADEAAAVALRDTVQVAVVGEVARTYVEICTLGEQIDVAQHSVDVATHEAKITADRNEAGANSRFDVVRTQALEARAQAALPALEGQRVATLLELTALIGRTPALAPKDVMGCRVQPHLAGRIAVGNGAGLLKRRPDVRAAERRLAAATARIGVATADLYPRITLSGFYGGAATDISALGTNPGLAWGVGPAIQWAFPNQLGPRAKVREARADAATALAQFDGVVLKALKETEQALSLYAAELRQRDALRLSKAKAHEAYGLAHEAFLAGSLSTLDLLTTEDALIQADAAVARSDAAVAHDEVALFRALGGSWRSAFPSSAQNALEAPRGRSHP